MVRILKTSNRLVYLEFVGNLLEGTFSQVNEEEMLANSFTIDHNGFANGAPEQRNCLCV